MERSRPDFEDMRAFIEAVEAGGLARAAASIGVSKSIVSRRIARLERQTGAALLTRSARGAVPTETGLAYYKRLRAIFEDLELAGEEVSAAATLVAGPIRMTAPIALGVHSLTRMLAAFLDEYPRIELDLILDDGRRDIVSERFDLAVRVGTLADSGLIARRLAWVRAVVVASPAYLDAAGRPRHPEDLAGHRLLHYSNIDPGSEWSFRIDGRVRRIRGTGRLRANNGDALCELACAGAGIAMLPEFIAGAKLASGELVSLLGEWELPRPGLFAVMPPERAPLARVQALARHLQQGFSSWRE